VGADSSYQSACLSGRWSDLCLASTRLRGDSHSCSDNAPLWLGRRHQALCQTVVCKSKTE
jgi:hypothetical protein